MEAQLPHSTTAEAHKKEADTTPLDEQLARELHAQLNDPQNAPPLTRRRTRKAPSFYTPQAGGSHANDASGADSGDLASPQRSTKRLREDASPSSLKPLVAKSQVPVVQAGQEYCGMPSTAAHQQETGADDCNTSGAGFQSAKRPKPQHSEPDPSPFSDPHEQKASIPQAHDLQQGPESPRSPGSKSRGVAKLPKLPMVRKGDKWYRGRLLRDSGARVFIEVSGLEEPATQEWLPKDSDRLWRGSYKGKDWRYLGDGAWEPRAKGCRRSSMKASGSSNSTDDQVRLAGPGADTAGQPCLRCKTSSGTTQDMSQGSKGSSSDRSSLAEDLFEAQGNNTPASHPRGKQRPGPFNGRLHPDGKNMKDEADGPTAQVEADDKCAPVMQQEMPRNLEGSLLQASIERMKSEQGTDAAHPSGDHITHTSEPGSPGNQNQDEMLGDGANGTASGLQCEEALPEDDLLAGKAADSPTESMREDQSQAAGSSPRAAGAKTSGQGQDGGSSDEPKPHVEPRRRNIRKRGSKRPPPALPDNAEDEGSGEDIDGGAAVPEQQTIRASSRIRTPAMKPEDSDFILTHELGRKAPRLTDSGDGTSAAVARKGGGRKGNRALRKTTNGAGPSASLDHLSDGQEYPLQPSDSGLVLHGDARKARRSGLAKGPNASSTFMRKQKEAGFFRRESSGISAATVCGNSLGTLIQALQAHENKIASVHQVPKEPVGAASPSQQSSLLQPQIFTGKGGHGLHGQASSPPNLGPLMVPQILAAAPEAFISCGQHALAQHASALAASASAPKSPPVPLFV